MMFKAVYPVKIVFKSVESPLKNITEAYNVVIPTVIPRIETATASQSPQRFSINKP